MIGDLSRSFEKWEARTPFPHRLTTKEVTTSRILAWNAAIERAAGCIACECDICTAHIRSILGLRVLDENGCPIGAIRPLPPNHHHTTKTGGK